MQLFVNGVLNPQVFSEPIRRSTHNLNDVLVAAVESQATAIESTHFLMALSNVPSGNTQTGLARFNLSPADWQSGLSSRAEKDPNGLPPASIAEASLHESARAMLRGIEARCDSEGWPSVSESVLLLYGLRNATPPVHTLCSQCDVDLQQWCEEIEHSLQPVTPIDPFQEEAPCAVITDTFSSGARKVLGLLRTETESMGYAMSGPRQLLLALLERDTGILQYALHQQGLKPRAIQESLTLDLRRNAKRTRSVVPLDKQHMQPLLVRILQLAGELAGRDRLDRIGEGHVACALVMTESTARRILQDEKVNVGTMTHLMQEHSASEEEKEEEETSAIADVDTIRQRMRQCLVGQDDAIERILPYIELMRFGFKTPGRPIGVFFFCGQSGSGKTELAKELARAVYGSEENLIYLEMGQFNAPESMNIFVGAPPGYVGYGEGKLTNGLRDKPCSVVLFDEVEKAHPRVLDALLRFLDEGKVDDPAGSVRDGSECILVLTSNVGSDDLSALWKKYKDSKNSRTEIRRGLREQLKKHHFRVEFLNRVDEVLLFHTLEAKDYIEIARRRIAETLAILQKERNVEVISDPSVAMSIGAYCANINEGARAVQRLSRSVVLLPVSRFMIEKKCVPPVRVRVSAVVDEEDPYAEPSGEVVLA